MPANTTQTANDQDAQRRSRLRRLTPKARPPIRSALQQLSAQDRQLLERCLSQPIECVYFTGFRNVDYQRLTPASALTATPEAAGDEGVLTRADERDLFLHFNYCRHRVMRILRAHRDRRLPLAAARRLLAWQRSADKLRSRLIRANVALVKAMAQRFGNRTIEMPELVSEGNLTLVRCVDKFDAARGYKFSTYACRAILAGFARNAARLSRDRQHAPTTYDPAYDRSDQLERQRKEVERDLVDELRAIIADNTARLTHTEQRVLRARFALNPSFESSLKNGGWALHRIGSSLGISKERVRQIQCRALGKLRVVLNERLAPTG